MIDRILQAVEAATGIKPIPLKIKQAKEAILYKWYKESRYAYRLEFRVISPQLERCLVLSEAISATIEDFGDDTTFSNCSVVQNGGGLLEDIENDMIHQIMYFDVITKE